MSAFPLTQNPGHHYYTSRRARLDLIVLHVTAGLEDLDLIGPDDSAERTVRYGQHTARQVSWHWIVDSDSTIHCLPDDHTAFHVRGYNSRSLGLEMCNRTATWTDKPAAWVERTLRRAAAVCHRAEREYGIPRRLLSAAQVDAGRAGYAYHSTLDPTRRRDPGSDFPVTQFSAYLSELDDTHTGSTEGECMRVVRISGSGDYHLITCRGRSRPMTIEEIGAWAAVQSGVANLRQVDVIGHLANITGATP